MFTVLMISILFFVNFNFFSGENLVTVLVGVITTTVGTQWIKSSSGLQGLGAMWLSIVLSLVVAAGAVAGSMLFSDGGFTLEKLLGSGVQIWALAQIAYKQILADK